MTFEKKKAFAAPQTICNNNNTGNLMPEHGFREEVGKPSLLLHSCCGPCSTAVVERLAEEFNVTVFFYNPCITDEVEYQKRRASQLKFIDEYNRENIGSIKIYFKEGPYRPKTFFELTKGLENEPEGGARCKLCFRQRLEKTAETAKLSEHDYFATTLTVSPHKNYALISEIGRELALRYQLTFLNRDFKKQNGFQRSIELSKKYELYRQNYCGCKFSKWER